MATYAAYRHVELDKVGCGKRRVLKPPGGGTSSLFSTGFEDNQKQIVPQSDSPSNVTSNNGLPNGIESVNGKAGNTSSSESNLTQKESDLDTVSIPSSIISAEIKNLTAQIQKRQQNGNPLTGDGCQKVENSTTRIHRQRDGNPLTGEGCQTSEHFVIRVHRQRDGNPVTGEGYDTQDSRHSSQPAPRTRVPPGGYSSGLW